MRKILLCFVSTAVAFSGFSQEKWDLKRAVDYAIANNISVKQADVQARMADVLAHPVEITTAEGFLIAAGSVADVPPQWRVGNIADQVRRQTRAIDQLVRAIDDADAEARNRRT